MERLSPLSAKEIIEVFGEDHVRKVLSERDIDVSADFCLGEEERIAVAIIRRANSALSAPLDADDLESAWTFFWSSDPEESYLDQWAGLLGLDPEDVRSRVEQDVRRRLFLPPPIPITPEILATAIEERRELRRMLGMELGHDARKRKAEEHDSEIAA